MVLSCSYLIQLDGAIVLSGCFYVKKGNGIFWFHLDGKFDVGVDRIEVWVEFIRVFFFYAHMAVIYLSEPPFGRVWSR